MTAGLTVVSRDCPTAFGNLYSYDDAIVPWLNELADECYRQGEAAMIRLVSSCRMTDSGLGFPCHDKRCTDHASARISGRLGTSAGRVTSLPPIIRCLPITICIDVHIKIIPIDPTLLGFPGDFAPAYLAFVDEHDAGRWYYPLQVRRSGWVSTDRGLRRKCHIHALQPRCTDPNMASLPTDFAVGQRGTCTVLDFDSITAGL